MSSVEELRRVMLHAADRLAEENPWPTLVEHAESRANAYYRARALAEAKSLVLAMQLAETTLRFVAAFVADPEPAAAHLSTDRPEQPEG